MIKLQMQTKVLVEQLNTIILGYIVGISSTNLGGTYIIKCIDNQLPNNTYKYDTFIAPLSLITVVDENEETLLMANRANSRLNRIDVSESDDLRNQITDTAIGWNLNIWLYIFRNDPDMIQRLKNGSNNK